ncbi:MAG TPA: arsenate reductase ArsC [Terriglobales bacterium]|nr:arsenate reductase ArsC [Terriglobales bacterium]
MAKPKVLFLCTGNSARSQMAEGLLRAMAGDRFEVLSAGTNPGGVNQLAIEAMQEIGIDISKHRSKNVNEFLGQPIEYVVTVCDRAKESCPIFPGTYKFLSWSLDDPAAVTGTKEEKLQFFRRIRDEISRNIERQFLPQREAR